MYAGSNLDSNYVVGLQHSMNFRELIDMAVVMPSRLNFYALHLLLKCFAEKMNILEERIDSQQVQSATFPSSDFGRSRLSEDDEVKKKSKKQVKPKCQTARGVKASDSSCSSGSTDLSEMVERLNNMTESARLRKRSSSSRKSTPRSARSMGGYEKMLQETQKRLIGGDDDDQAAKAADAPKEAAGDTKPEDKPAEKPEEKPAEKPEEKPEDKSAPEVKEVKEEKEAKETKEPEAEAAKPEEKVESSAPEMGLDRPDPEPKTDEKPAADKPEEKPHEEPPAGKSKSKGEEKKPEHHQEGKSEETKPELGLELPTFEAIPEMNLDMPMPEGFGEKDSILDEINMFLKQETEKKHEGTSTESSSYLGESLSAEGHAKKSKQIVANVDIRNLVTHSELDLRLLGVERIMKSPFFAEDFNRGVSIMKDQLELSMEHIRILSAFILSAVKDEEQKRILGILLSKLIEIRNENIYIDGHLCIKDLLMKDPSLEEEQSEEDELKSSGISHVCNSEMGEEEGFGFSAQSLYRSPSSIFREEINKIKEDICILYNKITELTTSILELDCTKLNEKLDELAEQVNRNRTSCILLQTNHEDLKIKVTDLTTALEETNKFAQFLDETKANLNDMEMRLAEKGDISLVARKVSHEKLEDVCNENDRKICEIRSMVTESERNIIDIIDNLRYTLGIDHFEELFHRLRQELEDELCDVRKLVQKFLEEQYKCVGAGGTQQVLPGVRCLSCSTPCTLKEKRKASLPCAHATKGLAPIVTYHLATLRKDEDDHIGYACRNVTEPPPPLMRPCPPRYAGGKHTTYTRKELVTNVFQKRTSDN